MAELNLVYTRPSDSSGGVGQKQLGWFATPSKTIAVTWKVTDKFAGFHRQGVKPFSQFLVAANQAFDNRLRQGLSQQKLLQRRDRRAPTDVRDDAQLEHRDRRKVDVMVFRLAGCPVGTEVPLLAYDFPE